jgi:lipopolysaccharide/colanic/teichoic acid biosynthesis glycosyltransferase
MYRDENLILEKSADPEYDYIHKILPDKIQYNLIFIEKRSLTEYFKIIFSTFCRIIFPIK